jgi:hypothetical protein
LAITTAAPFVAFSLSGAAMLAVAMGIWDPVSRLFSSQTAEAVGWSFALALGAGLAALHLALTLFYLLHAAINPSISAPIRILIAFALLWIPLPTMAVYCLLFILPATGQPQADDRAA